MVPEKAPSTRLLGRPGVPLAPGSKNFTSSALPGATAPTQLVPFDQLVSVPLAAFQEMIAALAEDNAARKTGTTITSDKRIAWHRDSNDRKSEESASRKVFIR